MITADVKDQTPKECMAKVGPGTGLFYVPSFASGKLEGVVQAMKDITYDEAKKYGEPCIAFKWVPVDMAAYEDLSLVAPPQVKSVPPRIAA
jgi:hypothetical protein